MAKWYMTVGCAGGEYASTSKKRLRTAADELTESMHRDIVSRPCPPDLAEWLDTLPSVWGCEGGDEWRMKVAGGWVIRYLAVSGAPAITFVPVAGAAGITVLEAPDETI